MGAVRHGRGGAGGERQGRRGGNGRALMRWMHPESRGNAGPKRTTPMSERNPGTRARLRSVLIWVYLRLTGASECDRSSGMAQGEVGIGVAETGVEAPTTGG